MDKERTNFETAYEWWKTQDKPLKVVEAVSGRFCVLYRNKWYIHPPRTCEKHKYGYGPFGVNHFYTSEQSAEETAMNYIIYEYEEHLKKSVSREKVESGVEYPRTVKEY